MSKLQSRKFDSPDQTMTPGRGKIEVISIGGYKVKKFTLQPGWKWSEDVKAMAKTETCQNAHLNIHISGRVGVKMEDGTLREYGPGELSLIPPGHDAWTVGNEPVVIIELTPTEF